MIRDARVPCGLRRSRGRWGGVALYSFARMSGMLDFSRDEKAKHFLLSRFNPLKISWAF